MEVIRIVEEYQVVWVQIESENWLLMTDHPRFTELVTEVKHVYGIADVIVHDDFEGFELRVQPMLRTESVADLVDTYLQQCLMGVE